MSIEPCPWCGEADVHDTFMAEGQYAVLCPTCNAVGPTASSRGLATVAWQRQRHPEGCPFCGTPSPHAWERSHGDCLSVCSNPDCAICGPFAETVDEARRLWHARH